MSNMLSRKYVIKEGLSGGGAKIFRKWSLYQVGDVVVGEYIGDHKDNYGKTNRILKITEAMFKGEDAKAWAGKQLVLNSCGMLDKAFEEGGIAKGEFLMVEYTGSNVIEKGPYKGKESHTVKIDRISMDDQEVVPEEELDL